MKTREEYESILNKTLVTAGTEGLERTKMDVLLDIRELLMWLKEDTLLQRITREREEVVSSRMEVFERNQLTS
jgi:hypothetical protein